MCDSDPEHARSYCPVTCDTCDSWAPATIGDISFLDSWDEDNCVDVESYCYWAVRNRCMVSPELMLKNCPVSCRQCEPKTTATTAATATTTTATTTMITSTRQPCEIIQHGSGTITSPGFPNNYTNNEVCSYTLNAEVGKTIKITFEFFAVEFGIIPLGCMFDRLTIEGIRYCGDELPSDGTIHIEKESAVLLWESDGIKVDRGFNFTWESISSSPSIEETNSFAFRNYQQNDENENLKNIVAECDELEEKRTGF